MQSDEIWVGKLTDDEGEFEILVPASYKTQAEDRILTALAKIQANPSMIIPTDRLTGEPHLLFVERVGEFDMVRPR